ncbi:MAG: phosphoribosylglycinamide formyltransferase [Candidatus Peribacteraceae bacterium]|nr:phosphoribosylglycinamide formyltransferase [Candidatus Peribacteraceae bacterium]
MNFVVLSSSRGTTFQAILDRLTDGTLTGCLGLVADREDRGCVEKARKAHLPVSIVEHAAGEDRESYDRRLDAAIQNLGKVELIAAIGWMYVLSPWFVKSWRNRILNVHPSLLPRFPGAHAHEDVLAAGEKESGMTIHLIDEGVDTGPILIQKRCPVLPSDTPDTLKTRVQELEKEWYPKVLGMIAKGTMILPPNPQS